jgi:DNA ligase (NAD+)
MPTRCPVCGSRVYQEGAYVFCSASLSCRAQLTGRILHYASRPAAKIEGLGEETVKQLVEQEKVSEIGDLYKLDPDQLETLEGFAEKSARKLHKAIQKAAMIPFDKFIYALGIRHVGEHIAGVLARQFQTLEQLKASDMQILTEIPEIGPEIARRIVHFFEQDENRRALKHLLDQGVTLKPATGANTTQTLQGLTFVFTGQLENYTRSQAQDAVERRGGRTSSSVSSRTDYVVVGENPGRKLGDAKIHKTKILTEKEFEDLLHAS